MIHFFGDPATKVFALQSKADLSEATVEKLVWLFGNAPKMSVASLDAFFVGPRAAMITPWSTNATEITQNMGITGIFRIEEFQHVSPGFTDFDPMLSQKYKGLGQEVFDVGVSPEPIIKILDIAAYNVEHGLSLSPEEIMYLEQLSKKLERDLTDSEVFGFSQVNSEHCRHKIFNGTFVIDGKEQPSSLFQLIKKTSKTHPNDIVSAYKDNVAFLKGPEVEQFAPEHGDLPSYYRKVPFASVISLKAETHNFPTTVEPFNGAATGSGGEIRDRLAGGRGSVPLAGTAVYMTSYSRLDHERTWEKGMAERPWRYQHPKDVLIKASNGASDFGNKFGQPLIAGSLFTFEHQEGNRQLGYDKVIMQAGGIGYAKATQALKGDPEKGDKMILLGGDNYRIGMGGAAVSSTDTGEFSAAIELNAIQRSNPEMQKRAANTIRTMVESKTNPIISIHDHGAGGHLNCLSELVENSGGTILMDALPVGDPTLSAKEIIGNESQERMGLVIGAKDLDYLKRVADRERSPLYEVGIVTGDQRFIFTAQGGDQPMDLHLSDLFGSSPKTIITDTSVKRTYTSPVYSPEKVYSYLEQVLRLEAVSCKDWLTNKVDRCVGGLVAKQQCTGPLQLPLNNCGVMALDFNGREGIATSIGHSPVTGLIDPVAGSRNSITEALTNIVWAPLKDGLKSVSLSANWMWPCKNEGEDARLYEAVQAVSEFSIALGINVPTGKDSLSMKQKYPAGEVIAPGTVIISATGHCDAIDHVMEPVIQANGGPLYYINLSGDSFELGGSSLMQVLNGIGDTAPTVHDPAYVKTVFNALQDLIRAHRILAGHDVASGGLITTLLEMCFATTEIGADIDLTDLGEKDIVRLLFSENCGVVFQAEDRSVEEFLSKKSIRWHKIGTANRDAKLRIRNLDSNIDLEVAGLRDIWFRTSFLLDDLQTSEGLAKSRFRNFKKQPLIYHFPDHFTGKRPSVSDTGFRPKAAIIREKGSNSEREMANCLYLAGFDVKDVHMTDLISGRETLEDIRFIGAVGGFSNSDVLGSAKGWAGAFKYNEKARNALNKFFGRTDTLSIGICNGCQLFMELDLINPEHEVHGKLTFNRSGKHESNFTSVRIHDNHSIMLSNLSGSVLGIWISHGEGRFQLPRPEEDYYVVAKYGYLDYPANPNGSDYNVAMLCDKTGRHLVTMPHLERSAFPWNWAYYEEGRQDEVSPWIEAFVNARRWLETADEKTEKLQMKEG